MILVITADDHALIRQGVKRILEKSSDIRVVAEAQDGQELLKVVDKTPCDILLLDVTMPGMEAEEIMHALTRDFPQIKILILSMHPEEQFALRMLKAGAWGYVNKSMGLHDLVSAVRRVAAGRRFISEALAEQLAEGLVHEDESPNHAVLSERELQIMFLLAQGKRIKEIAEDLYLSPKTVSTHRSRILAKMGMENNAQLTYYAIQNRLI